MKAIICDTCGKSVPDTKEADIMPLSIAYGKDNITLIEKDICPGCMDRLVLMFGPEQTKETEADVLTLKPAIPYNFDKEEAQEISDFIGKSIKAAAGERPDDSEPGESIEQETTFEVEMPKVLESLQSVTHINIGNHVNYKPADKIVEFKEPKALPTTIICVHCKKPFVPKSKRATTCSKHCSQYAWLDKYKLKNETPEQKKIRTDELLKKLKRENPIREIKEPSIYREM